MAETGMSTYRLDQLFRPRSVAIVGASPREGSPGRAIIRNLRASGFAGPLYLVNPDYPEIEGLKAFQSYGALPEPPDVAVVGVPPEAVPGVIEAVGRKGTAAAIVVSDGLGRGPGSVAEAADRAARRTSLRLVGHNSLGVMAPRSKFNASFVTNMPVPGDLVLISQSGGIAAGIAEWASRRAIGFSALVSIGDQIDVDVGDLLDYFAMDRHTRAILLYLESVGDARKFMSAARAAARTKPVVVVKSGRHAEAARAAATHTSAPAGADVVYDAAFRRAGLLRVSDLTELADAAETLGRIKPFRGKRLAVVTNGAGVGVLAVDRLLDLGGTVAELSPDTSARLDATLPRTWSNANPVDIGADAGADRYVDAVEALWGDRLNDALLVLNFPNSLGAPTETARKVAERVRTRRAASIWPKPVFAVWLGANEAASAAFEQAGIPHYPTQADAVRGFMQLVRYREALDALMGTPPSLPESFTPDAAAARRIVADALADGRTWLDPPEIVRLFAAYAIPVTPAVPAVDPDAAVAAAGPFLRAGQTVVLKVLSRDIVHKSEVGGVRLNLPSADAVRAAAAEVLEHARALRPDARIAGVTVHPMVVRPKARELIVGIEDDPTFGPVIVFGSGGMAAEVINDRAFALPPLDMRLAEDLIAQTRVSRVLGAYRNVPAVRESEVALVLVKLAQLVADVPEVREADINPLLADEEGVLALDARVAIAPLTAKFKGVGHPRFAVRPYPSQWERQIKLADHSSIRVRPLRPEDEPQVVEFFKMVTHEDLRLRFFAPIKEFSHQFVARLTQIDYGRAMAFAALAEPAGTPLGIVHLHADANYEAGEYAILLRSDLKGRGLGWKLMEMIIDYARSEGLKRIEGQVLAENVVMLGMCRNLGFEIRSDPQEADIKLVTLRL
jgi:acetyltransferase